MPFQIRNRHRSRKHGDGCSGRRIGIRAGQTEAEQRPAGAMDAARKDQERVLLQCQRQQEEQGPFEMGLML